MNQEDYVSYELSKALKDAGFNEPCDHYYAYDEESKIKHLLISASPSEWDWNYSALPEFVHPECSAPHIYHAQKWLREKKGIIVIAEPDYDSEDYCLSDYLTGAWYFTVWKDINRVHCNFDPDAEEERLWMFEKYEQALSAGIAAALELIRKEE